MISNLPAAKKPTEFVGSSKEELAAMPAEVKRHFGFAIFHAEIGDKHPDAKPLKGFGGAGVLEAVASRDGNTYRAVYTVKFAGVVYVLHAFQKKSKKGAKTPKPDIDLIRKRLKAAERHHEENYRKAE